VSGVGRIHYDTVRDLDHETKLGTMRHSAIEATPLPSLPLRASPSQSPLAWRTATFQAPHVCLIVGLLLATSAAGPVRGDEPPTASALAASASSVAIQVGDTPIFQTEVEAAVRRAAQGRSLDPAAELRLTAATVEQLVDERLLRREVEAQQVTVDEDEVTAVVTQIRRQLSEQHVPFEAFLAQAGRDEASLRGQIRLEAALNKLMVPKLTNDSLQAAFTKHRRDIDGTLVRASHIVLRPDPGRGPDAIADLDRRAAKLRSDILQGSINFAEAARRYSAGPSRRQGGDIGYFPRRSAMDEEFARQAFALAKGEMSQPFATASGVHLVLVTDVKPGDARPDAVRPLLEKLVVEDAIREILARGRQSTPIEYAAGVPHFETDADRGQPGRRVVFTGDAPATP